MWDKPTSLCRNAVSLVDVLLGGSLLASIFCCSGTGLTANIAIIVKAGTTMLAMRIDRFDETARVATAAIASATPTASSVAVATDRPTVSVEITRSTIDSQNV